MFSVTALFFSKAFFVDKYEERKKVFKKQNDGACQRDTRTNLKLLPGPKLAQSHQPNK